MSAGAGADLTAVFEPLGLSIGRVETEDGRHPLTLTLDLPRQEPGGDGPPRIGKLILARLLSDPAAGSIAASYRHRVHRALELFRPYLLAWLSEADLRLTLDVGDGGIAGTLSFERPQGDGRPLLPDLYLLESEPARDMTWRDFKATFLARRPSLFWRGSSTGRATKSLRELLDNRRVLACRTIARLPRGLADCKISRLVQAEGFDLRRAALELRMRGVMGPVVPEAAFSEHRMTIDLPGNTAAWGTCRKYLAGCLVLRPPQDYELIYSARLEPWTHFVPVRSDLADLRERLEWVAAHPDAAAETAWRGRALLAKVQADLPATLRDIFRTHGSTTGAAV